MIEPRARPGGEPPTPANVLPGEAATLRAAQAVLAGESRGLRALWPFLGPRFVAAVAYIDPGNFATNIAAGAKFGYLLVWVVIAAALFGTGVNEIRAAHELLNNREGATVAFLLGLALLASGLSSASVRIMSGQVVMQGFIRRRIRLFLRRAVTLAPALIVIGSGTVVIATLIVGLNVVLLAQLAFG